MTALPQATTKKLGLVIDLDTCVGCQACVTACKGWNDQGIGLSDQDPYGADPSGTFLNRVHSYQVAAPEGPAQVVTFPRSCLLAPPPDGTPPSSAPARRMIGPRPVPPPGRGG